MISGHTAQRVNIIWAQSELSTPYKLGGKKQALGCDAFALTVKILKEPLTCDLVL